MHKNKWTYTVHVSSVLKLTFTLAHLILELEGKSIGDDGLRPAPQRNEGDGPDDDLVAVMDIRKGFSFSFFLYSVPLLQKFIHERLRSPFLCRLLPPFSFTFGEAHASQWIILTRFEFERWRRGGKILYSWGHFV